MTEGTVGTLSHAQAVDALAPRVGGLAVPAEGSEGATAQVVRGGAGFVVERAHRVGKGEGAAGVAGHQRGARSMVRIVPTIDAVALEPGDGPGPRPVRQVHIGNHEHDGHALAPGQAAEYVQRPLDLGSGQRIGDLAQAGNALTTQGQRRALHFHE